MRLETMLAYAEVYEILNLLEEEYVEKIPEKVRKFFEEERMKDYKPKIDVNKSLNEQNIRRETMVLLAILNLNYWCESEEEKQEFINELDKNEREKRELEERYNPDNLFKNVKSNEEENTDKKDIQNVSLVEYKPSLFKRILEKITNFFKKS